MAQAAERACAARLIRESQNTQPPGLRFHTVMTKGSTQMSFYGEGYSTSSVRCRRRDGIQAPARWTPATSLYTNPPHSVLKALSGSGDRRGCYRELTVFG